MRRVTRQVLTVLVSLGAISGPPLAGAAGLEEGRWAVMVFGGLYMPSPGGIDDEGIYGIRGGRALTNNVVLSGSLGRSDIGPGYQTLLDGNLSYVFRPQRILSLVFTAGVGYAAYSDLALDDSYTMNAGFGPAIGITDRVTARALTRFRWFENRNDDYIDTEITLGVVFKLGSLARP